MRILGPGTGKPHRSLWAGSVLFALIVAVSVPVIWVLSADARREIDALATANSDSSQWSLAQAEVEFLSLESAVLATLAGRSADLSEVRKRFDIFYSRLQTVKSSPSFEKVRLYPDVEDAIARIDMFLATAVPVIDSGDAGLRNGLPALAAELHGLRSNVRTLSLAGVRVFASQSETQRIEVGGVLFDLAVIVFLLMALLIVAVAILLIMMHSSRRKTAEIASARSHLQAIIATSDDAILVAARDGTILDYNGAAERIFGYTRDRVLGEKIADLLIPEPSRDTFRAQARNLLLAKDSIETRSPVSSQGRDKDGRVFPIELSVSPAKTPDNDVVVTFIRDVSERVAAQKNLVDALDRAVAGEQAKADLLAVMSHEMRTPLNGVLGSLHLLSDTSLTERQRKFVDIMESSGQLLLEHVNNVLDISRVDAGKAEVAAQDFDLEEFVSSVVDGLQNSAEQRGNVLAVTTSHSLIGHVVGDPVRLRQILVNLLGNAIKFTENGRIIVEIKPVAESDTVEFRILDTGIGIPETEHERIFEDFITLDPSYQREVEGTGLGLGIVRRLVHLLDGEIGVDSKTGQGSAFWFRLSLPRATPPAVCASGPIIVPRQVRTTGASVLVIEDNHANRLVVSEMLDQLGCRVTEARDGQEGVERAQSQAFDLILMDISMPRMDGVTAARAIREKAGPNRDTPIAAQTAHALPDDIARFRDAGMADILTKPLSFDKLNAIVNRTVGDNDRDECAPEQGVMAELVSLLGPEKAGKVLGNVQADIRKGLSDIHKMIETDAPSADIARLAHRLSGSAGLVGLDAVRGKLIEIERIVMAGATRTLAGLVDDAVRALTRAAEL